MPKLKLGTILDDRPVKLSIELPAQVNRDLIAYAEVLGRETGQTIEPAKLVAPMLARFMSTDRAFARSRRAKLEPDNQIVPHRSGQSRLCDIELAAACTAPPRLRCRALACRPVTKLPPASSCRCSPVHVDRLSLLASAPAEAKDRRSPPITAEPSEVGPAP